MYHWIKYFIVILATLSCSLLPKPNIYKKGMENYYKKDYEKAIKYFNEFYRKSPSGDSTLFFLYNCYVNKGDIKMSITILEELAKRRNPNEQIYFHLFNYFRQQSLYYKINQLILNAPYSVIQEIDKYYSLTKRRCAELFTGAITSSPIDDPVSFVIRKGFLKPSPDGRFYENDTIKMDYFILLLDRFLPPVNPEKSFFLNYIKPDSYLYLPYLRLVYSGILNIDENINPEEYVPLSLALNAITTLTKKGYLK